MALRKDEGEPKFPVRRNRGTATPSGTAGRALEKPTKAGTRKTGEALPQPPKISAAQLRPWTYRDIRNGIGSAKVRILEQARIIEREDVRMIIPDRTLERRISAGEDLKPEEADGIARLVRVVKHARDVFENEAAADIWLRSPNPELGEEVPMRMAATDVGAREVEAVLTRIEHGVFS